METKTSPQAFCKGRVTQHREYDRKPKHILHVFSLCTLGVAVGKLGKNPSGLVKQIPNVGFLAHTTPSTGATEAIFKWGGPTRLRGHALSYKSGDKITVVSGSTIQP